MNKQNLIEYTQEHLVDMGISRMMLGFCQLDIIEEDENYFLDMSMGGLTFTIPLNRNNDLDEVVNNKEPFNRLIYMKNNVVGFYQVLDRIISDNLSLMHGLQLQRIKMYSFNDQYTKYCGGIELVRRLSDREVVVSTCGEELTLEFRDMTVLQQIDRLLCGLNVSLDGDGYKKLNKLRYQHFLKGREEHRKNRKLYHRFNR